MSSSAESATTPVTTIETSGSSTAVGTSEDSSGGSSTTAADSTTGGGLCTVDLPPSKGCAYLPEPGVVARGPSPSPWGDHEELLPDEVPGGNFIEDPDAGGAAECDIFAQDCPAGDKCMPWANDGGSSWNATRCTPIADDPGVVGDACTVEGSGVSGIDDCELGAMCFGVDTDTNMGHCIEQCSCSEASPVCETPNTSCVITNQGVLALCLPVCNPLDPDACEAGSGCFGAGELFHCAPDASGGAGAPGDSCSFINACDPGNFCANPGAVPGCAGSVGCCSAFCSLSGGGDCLEGQECVAWFGGEAPDECLGDVGACTAG